MATRILLVDDEPLIRKGLRFSLRQDGYETEEAEDGNQALDMILSRQYDLVLLDVMLPGLSGIEVCQRVRETSDVPIIMLTAKGEDMDKILGLEYGADDYMTKPFNILEVKARIRSILRRAGSAGKKAQNTVSAGELTLHLDTRTVQVGDQSVGLTTKEFDLLRLFMEHPGQIFTREELLETVWGADYEGDGRTVDVHVRRLREKIEAEAANPKYLQTKWGVGYHFELA